MAEVRFSDRALASIAAQDDWLRPLNPSAADRVLDEIERTCRLIGGFPGLGRRLEGTSLRLHVTRRYRYRIIYRLDGDTVDIREVLHPRQDGP
ncbi:MAG: type II toxin-antitoxin system RelE/ParE family toxin [Gemmobacter sp.]